MSHLQNEKYYDYLDDWNVRCCACDEVKDIKDFEMDTVKENEPFCLICYEKEEE